MCIVSVWSGAFVFVLLVGWFCLCVFMCVGFLFGLACGLFVRLVLLGVVRVCLLLFVCCLCYAVVWCCLSLFGWCWLFLIVLLYLLVV